MQTELSFLELFFGASFIVQIVIIILFILAGTSWWFIFDKWLTLTRAKKDIFEFEDKFWNSKNTEKFFIDQKRQSHHFGLSQIFIIVHEEFKKFENLEESENTIAKSIQIIISRQEEKLEEGLSFLSTVASVSPFIGLFGTVWGVMNAFSGLAQLSQVSINAVAPGISEALVATALGLFAAIPALISYNWSVKSIDSIIKSYENFSDELLISYQER
ncbi:MAG: protein TolQ [Gammaproteobacteria bacterium]|nr:MAG: protein TolQ [Gammaproteobacteria bacterium]